MSTLVLPISSVCEGSSPFVWLHRNSFISKRQVNTGLSDIDSIEKWEFWAKYGNNYIKVRILAVGTDYFVINNDSLTRGRSFMAGDLKFRRPVCVIGSKVVEKLFDDSIDPVGQEIKIKNYTYTIIGILKEKSRDFLSSIGSAGGQDANNRLVIPMTTYQRQFNTRDVSYIQAEAINISSAREAAEDLKEILGNRHKKQFAYESQTMQQYIATANKIVQGVAWIGAIAAIVSLVVGGIGIMNIRRPYMANPAFKQQTPFTGYRVCHYFPYSIYFDRYFFRPLSRPPCSIPGPCGSTAL